MQWSHDKWLERNDELNWEKTPFPSLSAVFFPFGVLHNGFWGRFCTLRSQPGSVLALVPIVQLGLINKVPSIQVDREVGHRISQRSLFVLG